MNRVDLRKLEINSGGGSSQFSLSCFSWMYLRYDLFESFESFFAEDSCSASVIYSSYRRGLALTLSSFRLSSLKVWEYFCSRFGLRVGCPSSRPEERALSRYRDCSIFSISSQWAFEQKGPLEQWGFSGSGTFLLKTERLELSGAL